MTQHSEASAQTEEIPFRPGFDHTSNAELLADHRAVWNRFREEAPAFRSDAGGDFDLWYLLRYDDNLAALQNPELFSSRTVQHVGDNYGQRMIPEEIDPPEHAEYRRALSAYFAPNNVRSWESEIRTQCVSLINGLADKNGCEFIADFAQKFPTRIFLQLVGLPVERAQEFIRRAHIILRTSHQDDPDGSQRNEAAAQILGDIGAVVAARRAQPRDDLITLLLGQRVKGEPIKEEELLQIGFLLYIAGLDTVANMLAYSFRHLARDSRLRCQLVEDPALIPDAVEEFLRLYSIAAGARVVTRDTEFAGCPMKAGDRIMYVSAASDRDPRQFPEPDTFVLGRRPSRHLAFGAGPHRCAGSHLARLELRIALEEWHCRIPDYEIPEGTTFTEYVGPVAGMTALPLRWAVNG